jgi:hypothetical protein
MLLGDFGSPYATALVLVKVGQGVYKRIGFVSYADQKAWDKCVRRKITLI